MSSAAELFRVTPDGFIAARDVLAADLRAEGRDDEAAAVKALRKPTVVVWALNQLAVRDPDGVAALLDAGRELRAAQQATLSARGGAERLREAAAGRRDVVSRLVAVAVEALAEVGNAGRTAADQMSMALEAASVDEEVGAMVAAGTLEKLPAEPAGFGDVFGLTSVPGGGGGQVAGGRELDRLTKAAARDRATADRLSRELEVARGRVRDLEAAHAEAGSKARSSELDVKRASRRRPPT